jgi:multimeric flavodoxin WrbA
MKLLALNGSPRKGWNTEQLLQKAMDGAKSLGAETELIQLYDQEFKGCISCFACKVKGSRTNGLCAYRDALRPILEKCQKADAIVIGSPIYFLDISAQTKCFLERLNYPGPSSKKIPSTFLYTMNADEESFQKYHIDNVIGTTRAYMNSNFGMEPDTVYSFNTFQYNDRENLNERFRRNVKAKLERREEQFPRDLEAAYQAGRKMVETIQNIPQ